MRATRAAAWLAGLMLLLATPAIAQNADFDNCFKVAGDDGIAICSDAISTGRYKGQQLADLYHARGFKWSLKREADRALADYDIALSLAPRFAAALTNRGNIYYDRHENQRALQDYEEAIRIEPRHVQAHNNRGLIYERLGRREDAIFNFRRALEFDPNFTQARDHLRRLGVN